MHSHKRHGFTIIELLFVIVIIALLVITTATIFHGAQTQARDTQIRDAADKFGDAVLLFNADRNEELPVSMTGATPALMSATNADELAYEMVSQGHLPAKLFTDLPVHSKTKSTTDVFVARRCTTNEATATQDWLLMYTQEAPSPEEITAFEALITRCGYTPSTFEPYTSDTYFMRGGIHLTF